MQKQNKRSRSRKSDEFVFRGFVSCDLTKPQQEDCRKFGQDADELFGALERLVGDGYTVKLSEDTYNDCYQCIIGGPKNDESLYGWFLAGRGSTVFKCVRQAVYKHYVVLDGVWDTASLPIRDKDFD